MQEPWRVGMLFSRTGLSSVNETEHFLGTALAIEEINAACWGGQFRRFATIRADAARIFAGWRAGC
jgi:ABC-type branched-subunit amino acid transport system substrate-binding protein